MKQILLMIAVVVLVGCGAAEEKAAEAKASAEAKAAADAVFIAEVKAAKAKAAYEAKLIKDPILEKAIRKAAKKPTGELTKADLEKVTKLDLEKNKLTEIPKGLEKLTQLTDLNLKYNQLTNVKGLEKLTQLKYLDLTDNAYLTTAQIDQLKKALPKCKISSNPKKPGADTPPVPTVVTNVATIISPREKYVHSFVTCFSPDADKHISYKYNIKKINERGSRFFWIPAEANKVATIVYRYDFNQPIKSAKLYGRMYANGKSSSGSFFASRDGRSWTLLKNFTNNAVPGKQEINVGIPAPAVGGNTLFIRVMLNATSKPYLIQFSRNDKVGNAYRIEFNLPSSAVASNTPSSAPNGSGVNAAKFKPIAPGEPESLMWSLYRERFHKVRHADPAKTLNLRSGTDPFQVANLNDLKRSSFGSPDWATKVYYDKSIKQYKSEVAWTRHTMKDGRNGKSYSIFKLYYFSDNGDAVKNGTAPGVASFE